MDNVFRWVFQMLLCGRCHFFVFNMSERFPKTGEPSVCQNKRLKREFLFMQ